MSTYVGEIIEIKVNGEWEVLKIYYDASYCMMDASMQYPEDVIVHKSYKTDFIENGWSLSDNDFYQSLLIDGEFLPVREMPEDASEEAKRIYNSIPNSPSIPSYSSFDCITIVLLS